nr:PTS sugar transporter subunit IIB [Terribacillus saccharophilus]
MIKLVRIDDRLLHGQVAFAWSRHLDVNTVIVANNQAASDPLKKMTLNLAKAPGSTLYVKTVTETIEILPKLEDPKFKALILVDNSKDALALVESYSGIKSINLGGMRMAEGKKLISRAIAVDENDKENLDEIISRGIEVEIRQVPTDSKKLYESVV